MNRRAGPKRACKPDHPRRAITTNDSPDVPFNRSLNPYQGCEHGCIYCFARPTHAYWNLGAGLDFETRLFYKPDLPDLLERELSAPGYRCETINLGANTDPYQPAEREHRISRRLLEVLLAHRHPVTIVTKGALIRRDLDLLAELASRQLVAVFVSLTTLDDALKRVLEPRAASPSGAVGRDPGADGRRGAGRCAARADHSGIDRSRDGSAARGSGRRRSGERRLSVAAPAVRDRAAVRGVAAPAFPGSRRPRAEPDPRDARWQTQRPRFGHRMRGAGPYAEILAARFEAACRRHGLASRRKSVLDTSQFIGDPVRPAQGELFARARL
jgi:DNA repair photolyase